MQSTDLRTPLAVRVAAMVAIGVLATLGAAYWLTYEPAPGIKVRWQDGTNAMRRAELERRYFLIRPAADQERTFSYALLDTRRTNIEALVLDREIEDTSGIDRVNFTVRFESPYGGSWTWVRYRIPLLREPGVVEGLAGAAALVLAACVGAWGEGGRIRRLLRSRG